MGVPRLFPWIKKRFAPQVTEFAFGELSKTRYAVDYLYLDANGLLHNAAQRVFSYGSGAHIIDDYENLSYEEKELAVFDLFMSKIQTVVSTTVPSRLLYIAIDGTAPIAKQAQQRQRRFLYGMDSKLGEKEGKFDTSSITPGTVFMHRLVQYMNYAIRRNISIGKIGMANWSTFEVIFSPPTVPGEGEHKIMDFMRNLPDIEKDKIHCMFGPDGDLIMLTLAIRFPKMLLFREDAFAPGYAHILEMSRIGEGIAERLRRPWEDAICDFIFLGFFVGNDFLPKIRMFLYLEDGLEFMIGTYKRLNIKLTERCGVTRDGLSAMIGEFALQEKTYLEEQAKTEPRDMKFVNLTLLRHFNGGVLDFEGYRHSYYSKFLYDPTDASIIELCRKYLRGLFWVFKYYTRGIPSWGEFYSERYAPLMTDMNRYLSSITDDEFDALNIFALGEPSIPFVQLISVLPPSSASLLPEPLRPLLTRGGLLDDVLPSKINVDCEGITAEHMGVIDLPFVSQERVISLYAEHGKECFSLARNRRGCDSIFFYDPFFNGKFVSEVGTVINLKAKKCELATTPTATGSRLTLPTTAELAIDKRLKAFYLFNGVREMPITDIKILTESLRKLAISPRTVFVEVLDVGLDLIAIRDAFPRATIYARTDADDKRKCILQHNIFALQLGIAVPSKIQGAELMIWQREETMRDFTRTLETPTVNVLRRGVSLTKL